MLTSDVMNGIYDKLATDLRAFLPELLVCAGIVWMLLARLLVRRSRTHLGWTALVFTLLALGVSYLQWLGKRLPMGELLALDAGPTREYSMFAHLLVFDSLTLFMRLFLYGAAALIILLCQLSRIPDREDSADFNVLLLGATLGMSLMASANHLLMIFIAVEMASLPSYALAGFLKGRRLSSEASLKYVVYGGGASGVMLYGISLIAGKFGTGFLPDVAAGYLGVLQAGAGEGLLRFDPILLLGTLFILIGVAFKLSAVPFHFWCPDVFEGAPAEVAGFLSVASKGAALALLGRFALVLAGVSIWPGSAPADSVRQAAYDSWIMTAHYLTPALAFFAAITATFGNFAAYYQTNLKRLLAYSTIAHAGYMLMGLTPLTNNGLAAVLFYLVAYLVMNLGAFAVVAFIRNQTGSEDLASYRGLIRKSPVLVITLGFFLLSLLGIPPLIGFFGKFQVFSVLYNDGQAFLQHNETRLGYTLMALLVIGGVNTVVSAVYYLNVLKVMVIDAPPEAAADEPIYPFSVPFGVRAYASVLAAAILGLSLFVNPFLQASNDGVGRFWKPTPPASTTKTVGVNP